MEYPREKFEELAKRLQTMAIPPEVDVELLLPDRDSVEYPTVVITYLEGDEEGPQKEIVFNEAYWSSSMESLLGAIMHQVKSLMEELQSFEGE
ncbi:MAG: hypothetical protein AB1353_01680 [Aquificota bacterium]|jgi:hypothetical protein|uniref:Uncharacterized protein n=1 Tax=Hydrogenobacter sp. TaxID=2152829 RepID=A0A7C2V317_9AQUI|nr:MAG: hypothetical protein KNN14_07745 [Aquificota bacterium]HAV39854.1 hypothetical protein [Aquificaceae bacterium]HCO39782.1 hypothetical protein [Aquificaceae bacterium]